MQSWRTHIAFFLGIIATFTQSGCVSIPSLTAGPVGYNYSGGRGTQSFRFGLRVVLEAIEDALTDIGATPTDRHADRHSATVKAKSATGTAIEINLFAKGITTEASIRFGMWGDRRATDELVEAIERRLSPEEKPAVSDTARAPAEAKVALEPPNPLD